MKENRYEALTRLRSTLTRGYEDRGGRSLAYVAPLILGHPPSELSDPISQQPEAMTN